MGEVVNINPEKIRVVDLDTGEEVRHPEVEREFENLIRTVIEGAGGELTEEGVVTPPLDK